MYKDFVRVSEQNFTSALHCIFERLEFILWWKTLWYSLLTIVECSTNFLERKNAPARQWQSVINPAGQQLRCDAQWADIWNFVWKPSMNLCKVEKILKGSLDSIPSPSPSVKIQIIGRKVCLRCKGKTLLRDVNKLFVFYYLKQTFPPIIWVFTQGKDDETESRLSS